MSKTKQRGNVVVKDEQRLEKYMYLDILVNEKNYFTKGIKLRIGQARSVFSRMKKVLCN